MGHSITRFMGGMASMAIRSPGLYCVELRTAQWETSVRWYREALGLRVMVRVVDDGYALLEAGETRLALIARRTPGPASSRWSLGFEVDNLEQVTERLVRFGSRVSSPERDLEGFRAVVTHDPDGNTVRLFCWPEKV
jgi:predicted enzyme related to lactoylglutathione lyase